METAYYQSPVGGLRIQVDQGKLVSLDYVNQTELSEIELAVVPTSIKPIISQLDAYFSGKLKQFNVDLDLIGTPFQRQVWQALTQIPYGQTITYAHLAKQIGRPKAVRAVGNANGKNMIPIIIPCHRVVASDNKLGGYSGGLDKKQLLLDLERRYH